VVLVVAVVLVVQLEQQETRLAHHQAKEIVVETNQLRLLAVVVVELVVSVEMVLQTETTIPLLELVELALFLALLVPQ
jgi:hypothetical protein